MPSITTDPSPVGMNNCLVQNLGPNEVYIGEAGVTTDTGLEVGVGDSIAVGGGLQYYAVSAGTSDVRLLGRATGYFPAPTPAA